MVRVIRLKLIDTHFAKCIAIEIYEFVTVEVKGDEAVLNL